ncbi:tetratricopeptide repeat protein [bacterium]|nr:tetratricopeptide repeat protein [bacterium]
MSINEAINKAIQIAQSGNFDEAREEFMSLLKSYPESYLVLSAAGLFYVNIGDFNSASLYLNKACEIKETFGTVSALGFCEYEKKEFKNSAVILERALSLGENVEIYNKLILSLLKIRAFSKAYEYALKMYEKYPKNKYSVINLVKSGIQIGNLVESEKICVEFLKDNSEISELWIQLGFLKELIYSDDVQALQCFKVALDLGCFEANYNIAVSYQKMRDFSKAEVYYKKMLEYFPHDEDSIVSLGMLYLLQKKFNEGYELFSKRTSFVTEKAKNLWTKGQKFCDDLVVLCEQGFGDHIQFIRYIPLIRNLVKTLQVVVPECLLRLFQMNYPDIEFITFDKFDNKKQTLRITDLAYALDMDFDNIPFSAGYLASDKGDVASDKLKIGLCWEAGSAGIRTMINRTMHINNFEPIFNLENIQTYSFQVNDSFDGCNNFPKMINLAKDFNDFSDTAKALKAMDLVVTVDTSVAHLAGALGVKTFLLLPYSSDWRWFDDTKTTPWYDSVEIFKQPNPLDWQTPINQIVEKIKNI